MKITNKDASVFLLESKGFDYIDVDPFGTPNPFLDAAVRRLGRDGILAVTATDTACLSGSVPKACLRKYWALPSDGHETGIRILIRKVQLIGAQYSKALLPIFSYAFEHYFRVFFRCVKGKKDVDAMLKLHGMHNGAGPLWLGTLWDAELAENIYNIAGEENGIRKFLWLIKNEAKVDAIGFYDINEICGRYKLHAPNKQELIARIKSFGYDAAETHFSGTGIRSGIPEEELIRAIKRIKF